MPSTNRRIFLLNSISSLMLNGVSIVVGVLMVPFALRYWHEEKYGVWILITTIISYLSLSNLGLNSAATTLISKCKYSNEKIKIFQKAIIIITVYLSVFFILGLAFLNENSYYYLFGNIDPNIKTQAFNACTIMLLFAIPNVGLSLISSAFIGFQKAYIDNVFLAIIPIGNLSALLITTNNGGDLVDFAILNGIFSLSVNCFKAFIFLIFYRKWFDDRIFENNYSTQTTTYREIIITGFRFLIMNIAVMISWNTDNIVISRIMGVRFVTAYAITFKLFSIAYSLMGIINSAINPIFAKEFGMSNWTWMNMTYRKMVDIMSFISGGICIGGILLSKEIITIWAGEDSYAGLATVIILGIYTYFLSINTVDSSIINTCNYTKNISWIYMISSMIKLLVSIVLVKYFGIIGVAIGTLISSIAITSWVFPFWIKKNSNGKLSSQNKYVIKGLIVLAPFIVASILISIYLQFGSLLKILASMIILVIYCTIKIIIMLEGNSEYILTLKRL